MKKFKYGFAVALIFAGMLDLQAQELTDTHSVLSVHVGPAWYAGKMLGIANSSDSYQDKLRNGVAWDAGYLYLFGNNAFRFALGGLYQGSRYEHADGNTADLLKIHYLAPQVGIYKLGNRYALSLTGGLGYQLYTDESTVYGRPRKVDMDRIAFNVGISGEYCFTSHWGVAARFEWVNSYSDSYRVTYHERIWTVDKSNVAGEGGGLSQLSLKLGVNYHF